MSKVFVPVNEFVSYAYGGDVELKGFVVCADHVVVWSSYLIAPEVAIWKLVKNDYESVVSIEIDMEVVEGDTISLSEYGAYDGPTILSDPYKMYQNIPTANDFLNIALEYS